MHVHAWRSIYNWNCLHCCYRCHSHCYNSNDHFFLSILYIFFSFLASDNVLNTNNWIVNGSNSFFSRFVSESRLERKLRHLNSFGILTVHNVQRKLLFSISSLRSFYVSLSFSCFCSSFQFVNRSDSIQFIMFNAFCVFCVFLCLWGGGLVLN